MDKIRRIKDCIKNSGLTQKEISERLGISEDSMARYLKGTSQLKLDTLIKISEII
ncbi:helix-turn-helix domain-containing protein [Clostridium sp. Marseille-P2415]|uniref:helix-turn-helix domain-containing protein n=1 Tax=Clostridium sp. Marseille-P2415 TaxID=1805471 RepID=UPI00135663AC|nr:helix-turn-helix transcriptional regulator [Clostridium sp. Marseille-P2415]